MSAGVAVAEVLPLPVSPPSVLPVTAEMIKAGRKAFRRERANLSDLYEFFACDLDQFISAIYREMAAASCN